MVVVCLLFVQMCRLVWSSPLVVCRQVPQDNLKVGLKTLLCAPPRLAPHPLEFICTYINDLLIITRGTLDNHIGKIEIVLARLRDAGLKVNAAKSFFCTHEKEYLGPKQKSTGDTRTQSTHSVKELQHFLGMVQY